MYKQVSRVLNILLLVILLGTCGSSMYILNTGTAGAVAADTSTPVPGAPPAPAAGPDPDWSVLQPGLERRVIAIYDSQNQPVESLYVWRLDQKYFRVGVDFNETPRTLETWQKETNALMVVNGGYYSVENERYFPDGLIIVNGRASGRSFAGFGGMLAVNGTWAELRWLVERPYRSTERLQAALQSFPILVQPGGRLGFGAERENHVAARRTAIGQDRQGRLLLMVAPQGYFTLHQFSRHLTESDLDLEIAINLDGGGSTGILVANPYELIAPTRALPFVILVYPR